MVRESTIDKILEAFEANANLYEEAAREFASEQPELLQYLMEVPEGVLTPEETEYLMYLSLVVWKAVKAEYGQTPNRPEPGDIEKVEEANWELIESQKKGSFRRKLDVFFENTKQEDLLAFIEDVLDTSEPDPDEEPSPVTKEGAVPMFIALKTLVDLLTGGHR
ncbi:MAG: hypothetical protein KatS3mg030_560 [Saprospiraceae bacterium]|nr:MAG: hypothetical protein KatS3mg030_560 [Saprospiraceae bacterium]